jgi:hypothetical protein
VLEAPLPADGPLARLTIYELRHLTSHLIAAGRPADLHRLLELEQADGRNAWFEVKGADARTGEYAADLAAAWQLARSTRDIPRQLRYALMSASVHSRWQYLPARLLSACVGAGLVPWSEAMSIIEQMPSVHAQAGAIEELGPVMPQEGLSFLLDKALALTESRDDVLKKLAPCLPLALVRRALAAVQGRAFRFEDALVYEYGFGADKAIHALIFRLAELGKAKQALDLFTRYRSVPLARRLASLLDDQERLFGDDAFLVAVLNSGGADVVEPARLGAWAERVVEGPADERTAQALLASFARLPRSARDLIDPLLLCAAAGDLQEEVSALVRLAPALDEPARRAALGRAVTLTLTAPVSERNQAFPELDHDPVRARLCLIVAPVLAAYADRGMALELARLAFTSGLAEREFTEYDGDWLGNALVMLADGTELDEAVRRVAATRDPWLRLHRIFAILPIVTDRYLSLLLPRVRKAIVKLQPEQQAEFLVRLLPWLPLQEREDPLTKALQAGSLLGHDDLELPRLVETLPPQARPRFLDGVMDAARNLKPADAATTLLAVARSSEPDRTPALLLEAARLHRDALLDPEHGQSGEWLPFTADEIEQLDLRELLSYYQVAGDEREISDYETGLLRVLGGPIDHPSEQERAALAEHYAEAGDLKTALTYGPLTLSLIRLAIPAASSGELLQSVAGLSADDQVQACLDIAREGPLDILGDVVEIARSFDDLDARGNILLSAAGRVPCRAEAVRLGQEAWRLAVEGGVGIPAGYGATTVPQVRGRWLGSAAIDVLLPLLPERERTDLLRRTLEVVPSLVIFGREVLLHLARLDATELRRPILKRAERRDRPAILAAQGDYAAAMSAIERLSGDRGPAIAAVAAYLPLEWLPRARALIDSRSKQSEPAVIGAIARRLCLLGEPDQGITLLRELSAERQGYDEWDDRETATGDLPVLLADHGYFSQALEALQFLPVTNGWQETPRLDVLARMVPGLTRGDPGAAHAAVFALIGTRVSGRWLHLLTVYAQAAAESVSERRWDEVLVRAASMTRAQALGLLAGIRPVTRALGGLAAIEEEARSVSIVRRWWPP